MDARHAFRSRLASSNFRSRVESVAKLCHIEIETRGAHSLRTSPLSSDWNALRMKDNTWVRTVAASEKSRLIDRTRRKKDEKRSGSLVNNAVPCYQCPCSSDFENEVHTPSGKILPAFDSHKQGDQENMRVRRGIAVAGP